MYIVTGISQPDIHFTDCNFKSWKKFKHYINTVMDKSICLEIISIWSILPWQHISHIEYYKESSYITSSYTI